MMRAGGGGIRYRAAEHEDGRGAESKMEFQTGEIIKLKKKHPCGSAEWEILRVGADFRLKCIGCGRQIMMARRQVEKDLKAVREKDR